MLNRQARSITGIYSSPPLNPLLCKAGLAPASTSLDYRQRLSAYRLLSLPDQHPAKEILPASLRVGDASFQLGEPPEDTLTWTENARPTLYGQWSAWQLTTEHSIDPANGVEPVPVLSPNFHFRKEVIRGDKEQALKETRKYQTGLVLWTDGSKLNQGEAGAAVCWNVKRLYCWKDKSIFLGKTKEILDAELWAISEALVVAPKETQHSKDAPITVFCGSQKALTAIQHTPSGKENRYLRGRIYYKAQELPKRGTL